MTSRYLNCLLLLLATTQFANGAERSYLEKSIGSQVLKLPQLPGFVPACEENKLFADRVAAVTPKLVVLVTCSIDTEKWRAYLNRSGADFYPMISVAISAPSSTIKFTRDAFEKLRASTKEKLGDLIAKTDFQTSYTEEDKKLAQTGVKSTRTNVKVGLQGFFKPEGETASFSYLVARDFDVVRPTTTVVAKQVSAVSLVLFSERLLTLTVVDQFDETEKGQRAQEITSRWLAAYRALNEPLPK